MAKKKVEMSSATDEPTIINGEVIISTDQEIELKPTHKQVLEALHAEMTKYGIHSIGQLEVLISKQ